MIVILSAISTAAYINYRIDCYGLFHDPRGLKLPAFDNERTSKFLFSYRYVPVNFNGLLIGSSISDNWDVSKISAYRIYNASLTGGNISEERLIAENVMAHGRLKVIIFCIYPYLTQSHGRKSGFMDPREYWGALGSIQLFNEYGKRYGNSGQNKVLIDENGRNDFEPSAEAAARFHANPRLARDESFVSMEGGDEAAIAEYAQLVVAARKHGAKVIAFIPPLFREVYDAHKTKTDLYIARISALFLASEKVINFNEPQYASQTNDHRNFYEGAHLTTKAANYFSAELAMAVQSE